MAVGNRRLARRVLGQMLQAYDGSGEAGQHAANYSLLRGAWTEWQMYVVAEQEARRRNALLHERQLLESWEAGEGARRASGGTAEVTRSPPQVTVLATGSDSGAAQELPCLAPRPCSNQSSPTLRAATLHVAGHVSSPSCTSPAADSQELLDAAAAWTAAAQHWREKQQALELEGGSGSRGFGGTAASGAAITGSHK